MSELEFRDAGGTGALEAHCDIYNAGEPLLRRDPVVIAHMRDVDPAAAARRELVWRDGELVGATALWHPRDTTDIFDVWAGALDPTLVPALFDRVEAAARAAGARRITSGCTSNQPARVEFLRRRGYRLLEAGNVSALELRAGVLEREFTSCRDRLRAEGLELTVLGARPDLVTTAHALVTAAEADVPTEVPIDPMPLDRWLAGLDVPWIGRDRVWLVVDGSAAVAVSILVQELTTGSSWTAMTGVARSHRGRGLALAVKLGSLAQAARGGARRVMTYNDERNHPMLAVNRRLGYSVVAQEFRHYIDV